MTRREAAGKKKSNGQGQLRGIPGFFQGPAGELLDLGFEPAEIKAVRSAFFYCRDAEGADRKSILRPLFSHHARQPQITRRIVAKQAAARDRPDVALFLACGDPGRERRLS